MRESAPRKRADREVGATSIGVAEAARRLRLSRATLYRLIKSGRVGAVRDGRSYRISLEEVERFLHRRYKDTG